MHFCQNSAPRSCADSRRRKASPRRSQGARPGRRSRVRSPALLACFCTAASRMNEKEGQPSKNISYFCRHIQASCKSFSTCSSWHWPPFRCWSCPCCPITIMMEWPAAWWNFAGRTIRRTTATRSTTRRGIPTRARAARSMCSRPLSVPCGRYRCCPPPSACRRTSRRPWPDSLQRRTRTCRRMPTAIPCTPESGRQAGDCVPHPISFLEDKPRAVTPKGLSVPPCPLRPARHPMGLCVHGRQVASGLVCRPPRTSVSMAGK